MVELIQTYWWAFLIALFIGFVTGYWAWAHRRGSRSSSAKLVDGAHDGAGGLATGPAHAAGVRLSVADEGAKIAAKVKGVATDGEAVTSGATSHLAGQTADVGSAAIAAVSDDTARVGAVAKPNISPSVGAPDNLLLIKGIGPKLNTLCQSLGITRFDQIANWDAADIVEVDQHLGTFRGRIVRDGWVEQAGFLAAGNTAAFEAKFGKLDSENK